MLEVVESRSAFDGSWQLNSFLDLLEEVACEATVYIGIRSRVMRGYYVLCTKLDHKSARVSFREFKSLLFSY